MLQIAQTVALVIASAVSLYALASTEVGRRREHRRNLLDRVLERVLDLMAAVSEWRGVPGQDQHIGAAKQRLSGALALARDERLNQADLLTRDIAIDEITGQAEGSVAEIQRKLESLDRLSWWGVLRKHELQS